MSYVCNGSFNLFGNCYTPSSVLNRCFLNKGVVTLSKTNKGNLVCVKHYNLEEITHEQYEMITKEIMLMRQFEHPNVMTCCLSTVKDSNLYVISRLMAYGSCQDLMAAHFHEGLPELAISLILRDVLKALVYLHSKGYIHRSVKARHILISIDGSARLSGLRNMCERTSNELHEYPPNAAQDLNWLSPEILQQNAAGYNEKSDIYSVGIAACELGNGIVPFADLPSTLILTEKMRGVMPQPLDCTTWINCEVNDKGDSEDASFKAEVQRKIKSRKFTFAFHNFVCKCCTQDVPKRPSSVELLGHDFFNLSRRVFVSFKKLIEPAVPYTSCNTCELPSDLATIEDLSSGMRDVCVTKDEWDFS